MSLPELPQAHPSESRGTLQEGHQKISVLPGEKVLSAFRILFVFCIDPSAVVSTDI